MVSMTEFEKRTEDLAVRFASDYGPLPAASAGDPDARKVMRERLLEMAEKCGLHIEPIQDTQ